MATNFDAYANDYREIINRASKITGEQYEYFIKLRVGLMRAILDKTISSLKTPSILDVGCGIGITEIFLKSSFPDARIFGVDTSGESIAAAEKLGIPDVIFTVSNSSALSFEDNLFDLIYSNGTIHHLERGSHSLLFHEMLRVMKKGGNLFIFENNPYNPLMMRAMKKNPFDKDVSVVYPDYLNKCLKAAGFRPNRTQYYFFFPRWLKFLRIAEEYLHWLPAGAQYFVWASK